MAQMTLEQLNGLLDRALRSLQADALTIITSDANPMPTKPWLPESYWLAEHQRTLREAEDLRLATTVSVADVLEEGVKPLWSPPTDRHGWGTVPMCRSGGTTRRPYDGDPQASFVYECYQCGRPITDDGQDHAGRRECDAALMQPNDEVECAHQAKAWYGEEREEDDDAF